MRKFSMGSVILASAVFLALSLAGHSAEPAPRITTPPIQAPVLQPPAGQWTVKPLAAIPAPVKRVRPAQNPYMDTVIFVEAFMVEVPLARLYATGVPAISDGGRSVSAEDVLKCVAGKDSAGVTAGAKLAVVNGREAKTDSSFHHGFYVGPPEKGRIEYCDLGTSLTAQAAVEQQGKISLELDYNWRGLKDADNDMGSSLVQRDWSTRLVLDAGTATLAGALQDADTAVFLIVTAALKSQQ